MSSAMVSSVRRELWENRSIYIAPLVAGVVVVFAATTASLVMITKHSSRFHSDPRSLAQHFEVAGLAVMGASMIVAIFYCLDALYGERRDRSVLFWKSMPVSDTTAVLSKMAVPLVVVPIVTFAITMATQLTMLLMSTAVLSMNGRSAAVLWQLPWFDLSFGLLYHLVTVHSLYYAPIFAWLLLVSAWAKRLPFLWAFLPPAAIAVIEKMIFNTSYFAAIVGDRVSGGMDGRSTNGMVMMFPSQPLAFLGSPGLWIGFAIATVCLGAAVRLRRQRDPI